MFEMHLISGIPDGWQGCKPPAKLNIKTGPLPNLYFGIYYSFGFSRLLFFCVFRSVFKFVKAKFVKFGVKKANLASLLIKVHLEKAVVRCCVFQHSRL